MNGVELAEAIRDIDDERHHFTYVILIGAVNHERVQHDDFHVSLTHVTGTKRVDVLEHLAIAGARISKQVNSAKCFEPGARRTFAMSFAKASYLIH